MFLDSLSIARFRTPGPWPAAAVRALPYEPDPSAPREDFCLGTDSFHTPDNLLTVAKAYLEARGHGVTVNRPFAGALVPATHYGKDRRMHALMVEVNRGLYMDEATGAMLPRFVEVKAVVQGLVERLAAWMGEGGNWRLIRLG